MANIDSLRDLYAKKKAEGLVDVKFALNESACGASADKIAGEVLALNEAIEAGAYKKLDFGDSHFVKALEARHPGHEIGDIHLTAENGERIEYTTELDEALADAVLTAVEISVEEAFETFFN